MGKKRLLVDMDGTLAKFHDEASYMERMFEKGFFRNLKPFDNMIDAIFMLSETHPEIELFIVSAAINSEYCQAEKNDWLNMWLPEIDYRHRIYTEMGKSKAEYFPDGITKEDYLLDDYNQGLRAFLKDGGSTIKCRNNINHKGLGLYGGQPGNLWTGSMVNTEDKPEMIAARICDYMGISYELDVVANTYGLDSVPFVHRQGEKIYVGTKDEENGVATFKNPLNCILWLSGDEKQREHQVAFYPNPEDNKISGQTGEFVITEDRLKAVLMNLQYEKTVDEFLSSYSWEDVQNIISNLDEPCYFKEKKLPLDMQIREMANQKISANEKVKEKEQER